MNTNVIEDWPVTVPKPSLPTGYEWICLRQAFGMPQANGTYPWWIRMSWTMKNGNKRHLKISREYFINPMEAIEYAVKEAQLHRARKQ